MGNGSRPAERPADPVILDRPFLLGRTEVTFDQWQHCVADGVCRGRIDDHGWGRGRRPVINVSWHDANAYARWVSAKSGLACRLPTEAEWEYAARAGTTTPYWWGEQAGEGMANCRDCAAGPPPYGTREAGSYAPNPWGLADMNGNVWEWTADCWTPSHDGACSHRVIKGGAWYYFSTNARAAARARNDAATGSYTIGFRLLCDSAALNEP